MVRVPTRPLSYPSRVAAQGPGGFSEYVLWRRGGGAKGFGFTLRNNDNDFTLERFHHRAAPELFHPYAPPYRPWPRGMPALRLTARGDDATRGMPSSPHYH